MAKYYHGLIFKNNFEREKFVNVVRKRMAERSITVPELANQIGYNRKSVYQFFNTATIDNKFLAASIANALEIDKMDWIG